VQLLLEGVTDLNQQGANYNNALQAAAAGGHNKIIQLLLDKGANVNA
jgi:ankyrin repeat protein